ncbi:MAG: hypothetical protein ACYC1D_08585 [Acidimicrobiales bacterium]
MSAETPPTRNRVLFRDQAGWQMRREVNERVPATQISEVTAHKFATGDASRHNVGSVIQGDAILIGKSCRVSDEINVGRDKSSVFSHRCYPFA